MAKDIRILTTIQFLDILQQHFKSLSPDGKSPVTDYRVAMEMGWSTSMMSLYRSGKRSFGDDTAVDVADRLGMERGHVLSCVMLERARSDKVRDTLRGMALGGTSAAMLAIAVFQALPGGFS